MPAQPVPVNVAIAGGVNEKLDATVTQQPQRILNARYEKSGALSKRYGYDILPGPELPHDPLPATEDGYLALDGDKFFARKSQRGMDFYQRRRDNGSTTEHRLIGSAGTQRPVLTQLPAQRGQAPKDGLLCDVVTPSAPFANLDGEVIVYVRLEMTDQDLSGPTYQVFDIVLDYIDANDRTLTVREPTRIPRAVKYAPGTHQQIRAIDGVGLTTGIYGVILVYTNDATTGPGSGIYWRVVNVGATAAGDTFGNPYAVVATSSSPAVVMTAGAAGFDVDTFRGTGISLVYGSAAGLAWARVLTLGDLTASLYSVHAPGSVSLVTSVAMSGATDGGATQEVVFAYTVSRFLGAQTDGYAGRFNATAAGAPTGVSVATLYNDVNTGVVPPHSAVCGRFLHDSNTGRQFSYLAGVNTGSKGFLFQFGDFGQATLYAVVSAIACAWATGRPHALFTADGDIARVAMPMVSWGGVLGGGAGLLADVTPLPGYRTAEVIYGTKLLATYAIDQVSLYTETITVLNPGGVGTARSAAMNARIALPPIAGGSVPTNNRLAPRWLIGTGQPPTAVMLEFVDNVDDYEFVEPGVMLVGPGVPVLCDAINGVSEIGFHSSPGILRVFGISVTPGTGYAAGTIIQYRFQYRFVDGLGRAQVGPISDPIQMTSTVDDVQWTFELAPLDVTLRGTRVLVDVYRTEDRLATFYWTQTVTAEGGLRSVRFTDRGATEMPLDKNVTPNVESYWMTPPCAIHAFRGAFRDVLVTRENELWPSNRRLSTTAPQFDIVNSGAWDSNEPVVAGGEIDGKVIIFSRSRIGYTYEMNGSLAPVTEIPSDTGAVDGSRAFSTHMGVFYQSRAGIRIVGRDMAIHEVGLPVVGTLGARLVRGGIKVPAQGEIRLRLNEENTYLVFDYFHGTIDAPVWYVYRYDDAGTYVDADGVTRPIREFIDQQYDREGRLVFLCRAGILLYERPAWYRDYFSWVPMIVRSAPMRGPTPLTYLATVEGAVNLELPAGRQASGFLTLRLVADYDDAVPSQPFVAKVFGGAEAFDRRQLQVTATADVMNAPACALEYDDTVENVDAILDGFGYRLSAMVLVYAPRDPKILFPVADGARK